MVKIDNQYYIKADSNCFMLIEKTKIANGKSKKVGEIREIIHGYYTTIQGTLRGLSKKLQREIVIEKNMNLREALKEFEKIEAELIKLIKY